MSWKLRPLKKLRTTSQKLSSTCGFSFGHATRKNLDRRGLGCRPTTDGAPPAGRAKPSHVTFVGGSRRGGGAGTAPHRGRASAGPRGLRDLARDRVLTPAQNSREPSPRTRLHTQASRGGMHRAEHLHLQTCLFVYIPHQCVYDHARDSCSMLVFNRTCYEDHVKISTRDVALFDVDRRATASERVLRLTLAAVQADTLGTLWVRTRIGTCPIRQQ